MSDLIIGGGDQTEEIDRFEDVLIGQWYWVTFDSDDYDDEDRRVAKKVTALRCVVGFGSNYIEFDCPMHNRQRVHISVFFDQCKLEPNYSTVIDGYIAEHRIAIQEQMKLIKSAMNDLRLYSPEPGSESRSLSVVNQSGGVTEYRGSLGKLKDEVIPKAKEVISGHSKLIECWLTSKMLGAEADMEFCDQAIEKVKDRIFEFSIYAGLTESIATIREGSPAPASEKIHIMQRTCFMDEECLAAYRVGGISCESIEDFDQWLADPENFGRLLPFPKCVVAFQVRRYKKRRDCDGSFRSVLINMNLGDCDEWTFLYIRNGASLYRVSSEHEFGWHLFPDKSEFDLTEPMMARSSYWNWDRDDGIHFITKREFDELVRKEKERPELCRKWKKEAYAKIDKSLPKAEIKRQKHRIDLDNPYYRNIDIKYEPFDTSSVYYDDMVRKIGGEIKSYNKVVLLIQGLADRSTVFFPCAEIKMWDQKSIEQSIRLIYDGDMTLSNGEKPSFEKYLADRSHLIKKGSLIVGHMGDWLAGRAEYLEERRYASRWDRFQGDPTFNGSGPPDIVRVSKVDGDKVCIVWREPSYRREGTLSTKRMKIDISKVLDVSGYNPGDFKQFFDDHRSRQEYLKWANVMLLAEEFHAGNMKAVENGFDLR